MGPGLQKQSEGIVRSHEINTNREGGAVLGVPDGADYERDPSNDFGGSFRLLFHSFSTPGSCTSRLLRVSLVIEQVSTGNLAFWYAARGVATFYYCT